MIGALVPEDEKAWHVLMELKDIVELVTSPKFSEDSLCYLDTKIADHRLLFKEVFQNEKLKPKHHFIEHYPHLIRCFGPLLDLWTMRYESKHSCFKRIVRDSHNTKHILKTLANRHQLMQAYVQESFNLFKPVLQVSKVKTIRAASLEPNLKAAIERKLGCLNTLSFATTVTVHGTTYTKGLIVSVGSCSGLPEFSMIQNILITNGEVLLILKSLASWYIEHLRAFDVVGSAYGELHVKLLKELNDFYPLTGYRVGARLLVCLKRFIHC